MATPASARNDAFAVRSLSDVNHAPDQARAAEWIAARNGAPPLGRLPALAQAGTAPHRVNQLDAVQLDDELASMLRYQVLHTFKYARAETLDLMRPELDALLHVMIWSFSIAANAPSPGDQLQNLRYRSAWSAPPAPVAAVAATATTTALSNLSVAQRVAHGALAIGARWGWQRLAHAMTNAGWGAMPATDWRKRFYVWSRRAEVVYRGASVLNFLAFLFNGRYRSLVDRLLGMRLAYINPKLNRQVSFEFMNQQLVWSGLAEFLMFLMPLLNLPQLRAWCGRCVRWMLRVTGADGDDESGAGDERAAGDADAVPRGCAVCAADPIVNPWAAQCGHCFCYACLAGSRIAESRFRCPRCDEPVTEMARALPAQVAAPRAAS